ncbi:MAG: hypothetical protein K0A89_10985 [ANME-2 cluster archaeon]|nr:hypothetical protein [ANME-2 cluster archaeon]
MIPLHDTEMLMLRGNSGVIGIVKAGTNNLFFLETDEEEIVLGLEPDDLLVSSGFDTKKSTLDGVKCVLYMIREVGTPLIVLPKHHPASKRLKIVVSVGPRTRISCDITPGTHPEQDVLCGVDEFSGVEIVGVPGGVEFRNMNSGSIERIPFTV